MGSLTVLTMCLERIDQVRKRNRQERRGKAFLALEVIVKRGLGDAGRLDNLAHRRRLVAPIRKEPGSHPRDVAATEPISTLLATAALRSTGVRHVMTLKIMKATSLNGKVFPVHQLPGWSQQTERTIVGSRSGSGHATLMRRYCAARETALASIVVRSSAGWRIPGIA